MHNEGTSLRKYSSGKQAALCPHAGENNKDRRDHPTVEHAGKIEVPHINQSRNSYVQKIAAVESKSKRTVTDSTVYA